MSDPKVSEKIPVLAFNTQEFVNWLLRKRKSKRDYVYLPKLSDIKASHSRIFVVLPGSVQRRDWAEINEYFLREQPALIAE